MHCIYKDNLVPYPMPGATLPVREEISGSRLAIQVNSQTEEIRILGLPGRWAIWEWSVAIKNILIRYLSLRRMNISDFCPVPLAIA